jgi:quinol monooxygenase YgiN
LVHLVNVSATEPKGISYYWGQDLDGEPNTLWGLEGYTDADGFFTGHPASEVFKTQMAFVDKENLLAEDYDLHHYESAGGWLTRKGDQHADSVSSHVAVVHFFTREGERDNVISQLNSLAAKSLQSNTNLSSCYVLREINNENLVTLWLR